MSDITAPTTKAQARNRWVTSIGGIIFLSRWLQAPLYLGLIYAQVVYVVVFLFELVHLAQDVLADPTKIQASVVMLGVLGLIDVVMIANLMIMTIIGGYETFVSKLNLDKNPDRPEWLSHVNSNVLKTKLAMSIIGISSIHLLKTFIEVADLGADTTDLTGETYTSSGVLWQVVIHMVFIASAVGLAMIDRWNVKDDFRDRRLRLREMQAGITVGGHPGSHTEIPVVMPHREREEALQGAMR
ncbi:TIGR00645 family protein [Homoserinimonas hongtaonis]|uniref:UPF0114 protein DF220_04535 n=1 Tax=Homoserinimonas hongtaonis TaxID=2079791 RepID=A0A2U1T083_9MICO|nr:TIGR00645 family protein [Salinibacterium hongtaonis]PWB97183.1 TIGR00645 family protein [Salinibacterium hongtaonis]